MIDPKLGNLFMMSKVSKSPSVFLDRDGVLNKDIGYVHKPSQISWIPGAKEAVALLKNQGYLVFVVTNQSGIARGLYTGDEVEYLHKGIAERNFVRTFKLAEYVEVKEAKLTDGILRVKLFRNIPDALKPQKIKIG